MARNKHPEVTRGRILGAARKLFLENGWEKTTIQDIVDELGDVTRGAFYHHFKSKEDIIDAVIAELFYSESQFDLGESGGRLNGLQKLRYYFVSTLGNQDQLAFIKAAPSLLQSPVFIGKQARDCVETAAPYICQWIEEGNRDGSLQVAQPRQAAETFLLLGKLWLSPAIFLVEKQEYNKKILHLKAVLDGIGLPIFNKEILNLVERYYDYVAYRDK